LTLDKMIIEMKQKSRIVLLWRYDP